ncbi:MAG: hypothetical protein B6V02_00455 [Thermoprotei archaeon ex4572_64]|nr:MAG: hypothetical protein B6V02_00455 [Thermoprotei archaeon ex4572_64]
MLAYIDHALYRGYVESIEKLEEIFHKKPALSITLVIIDVNSEERDKLRKLLLETWSRLTGNKVLIEELVSLTHGLEKNIVSIDKFRRDLIKIFSKHDFHFEDLSLLNIYMKTILDMNVLDLDLVIIYENPQLVINGYRQKPITMPGVLLRREVLVEYGRGRKFNLEVVILIQRAKRNLVVIDWSSNGLIPYTPTSQSLIDNFEVGDPVFTSYYNYGVKLRSSIRNYDKVIVPVSTSSYHPCSELLREVPILNLPKTLKEREIECIMNYLRRRRVHVIECIDANIDIIIGKCLSESESNLLNFSRM